MNCPHCKTELIEHVGTGGAKEGAQHCFGCGCCFEANGKTARKGVPVCVLAKDVPEEETKPIGQMNKTELLDAVAEAGFKVEAADYTVTQLRALLSGTPTQEIIDEPGPVVEAEPA